MLKWTALYPTVHFTHYALHQVKWTRGKVADCEQNFEHPTLGFAPKKSFQRKTNNSNVTHHWHLTLKVRHN